jgi:hypothetical protein
MKRITDDTIKKIKRYSIHKDRSDSLLALLDYYDKNSLQEISEQEGLEFLRKLRYKEIKIN